MISLAVYGAEWVRGLRIESEKFAVESDQTDPTERKDNDPAPEVFSRDRLTRYPHVRPLI